jgi:amidohydrolase
MTHLSPPRRPITRMMARLSMLLACWVAGVSAGTTDDAVRSIVADNSAQLIANFKQFHQNPELGFQEVETAATIAAHLEKLGYPVKTGVGRTGVVSVLENGPGPVVLFRSDMDALPIEEQVDISYASSKITEGLAGEAVPVMHACGHDSHAAWLMGVATVMMEMKDQWSGTLILVAQPAEELLSGAQAMLSDAIFAAVPEPDYVIAGHQFPWWPVGSVALQEGYRMAGSIQMDVEIYGSGGHGSAPHMAIDPVVMGAQAVLAYQAIVSRRVDQSLPAVLTVGSFKAGIANNVIPDSATLKLNLRWYDPSVRDAMVDGITSVTDSIARMYGAPADRMPVYTMKSEVGALFNEEVLARRAAAAMKSVLGDGQVFVAGKPHMGSEDFHMLAARNPGAKVLMVEVGSGPTGVLADVEAGTPPVYPHNPAFYMDPDAVLYGAQALSAVLLDLLQKEQVQES